MLRVAVPNKGALAAPAAEMLAEAGYRKRHDQRDLTVLDPANDVEFFFLRPKDIPIYVGSGELDLGITGRDQALESRAPVAERLPLGFGGSTFRYAAPAGTDWKVTDLEGKRLATSYPNLVKQNRHRRVRRARRGGEGGSGVGPQVGGDCQPGRSSGWSTSSPLATSSHGTASTSCRAR
jgi:ATP phosphoribosyltransferase